MRYAANPSFLYTDFALPDAVRAVAQAGFATVERHFPFDTPVADLNTALAEIGPRVLRLNTRPGDRAAGEFGLCALPDR